VLATLILAAPPVTAIGCGLAWYPALNAVDPWSAPYFAPWLVIACSALGMLLVFVLSWRASAQRPTGIPGPMAWWIRAGLGLCTLAVLYCALLLVQAPRREPFRPQVAVPMQVEQLVGLSREQVLACLGPPVGIRASAIEMTWNYSRLSGDGQDALMFTNGSVVGVLLGGRPSVPLLPGVPTGRTFLGQSVSDLVRELGPATGSVIGPLTTELTFADGTIAMVTKDGVVMGLSPK
jgi:hypothetical protein